MWFRFSFPLSVVLSSEPLLLQRSRLQEASLLLNIHQSARLRGLTGENRAVSECKWGESVPGTRKMHVPSGLASSINETDATNQYLNIVLFSSMYAVFRRQPNVIVVLAPTSKNCPTLRMLIIISQVRQDEGACIIERVLTPVVSASEVKKRRAPVRHNGAPSTLRPGDVFFIPKGIGNGFERD